MDSVCLITKPPCGPKRSSFAGRIGLGLVVSGLAAAVLVRPAGSVSAGTTCTYVLSTWNVRAGRAMAARTVRHPYAETTRTETDPDTGCTVCQEDQQPVEVPGVPPFLLCKKLAPQVQETLRRLIEQGELIHEITGYRVGKTRGPLDSQSNRTVFSNHSFGVALDINAGRNGLYDQCPTFGAHCRLLHGGPWRRGAPGTLFADGPIVTAFKSIGLRWGGAIDGNTKDFMHVSPSGY